MNDFFWLIENDRYSNFVNKTDFLCNNYLLFITSESYEKLYSHLSFYIEKSSIDIEDLDEYILKILFKNGILDRDELHSLEKRIIQGCMYQANLYKFMGTVGLYTQISKSALQKSGVKWEDILPSSYKEELTEKCPISNILKKNENSVAIYSYPDGSLSAEYKKENAKLSFKTLEDKSGFDFSRKGYDPNYEIEKTEKSENINIIKFSENDVEFNEGININTNDSRYSFIEKYIDKLNSGEDISLEILLSDDGIVIKDEFYFFLLIFACVSSQVDLGIIAEDDPICYKLMRILKRTRNSIRDINSKIVAIERMNTPFDDLDDEKLLYSFKNIIGHEFFSTEACVKTKEIVDTLSSIKIQTNDLLKLEFEPLFKTENDNIDDENEDSLLELKNSFENLFKKSPYSEFISGENGWKRIDEYTYYDASKDFNKDNLYYFNLGNWEYWEGYFKSLNRTKLNNINAAFRNFSNNVSTILLSYFKSLMHSRTEFYKICAKAGNSDNCICKAEWELFVRTRAKKIFNNKKSNYYIEEFKDIDFNYDNWADFCQNTYYYGGTIYMPSEKITDEVTYIDENGKEKKKNVTNEQATKEIEKLIKKIYDEIKNRYNNDIIIYNPSSFIVKFYIKNSQGESWSEWFSIEVNKNHYPHEPIPGQENLRYQYRNVIFNFWYWSVNENDSGNKNYVIYYDFEDNYGLLKLYAQYKPYSADYDIYTIQKIDGNFQYYFYKSITIRQGMPPPDLYVENIETDEVILEFNLNLHYQKVDLEINFDFKNIINFSPSECTTINKINYIIQDGYVIRENYKNWFFSKNLYVLYKAYENTKDYFCISFYVYEQLQDGSLRWNNIKKFYYKKKDLIQQIDFFCDDTDYIYSKGKYYSFKGWIFNNSNNLVQNLPYVIITTNNRTYGNFLTDDLTLYACYLECRVVVFHIFIPTENKEGIWKQYYEKIFDLNTPDYNIADVGNTLEISFVCDGINFIFSGWTQEDISLNNKLDDVIDKPIVKSLNFLSGVYVVNLYATYHQIPFYRILCYVIDSSTLSWKLYKEINSDSSSINIHVDGEENLFYEYNGTYIFYGWSTNDYYNGVFDIDVENPILFKYYTFKKNEVELKLYAVYQKSRKILSFYILESNVDNGFKWIKFLSTEVTENKKNTYVSGQSDLFYEKDGITYNFKGWCREDLSLKTSPSEINDKPTIQYVEFTSDDRIINLYATYLPAVKRTVKYYYYIHVSDSGYWQELTSLSNEFIQTFSNSITLYKPQRGEFSYQISCRRIKKNIEKEVDGVKRTFEVYALELIPTEFYEFNGWSENDLSLLDAYNDELYNSRTIEEFLFASDQFDVKIYATYRKVDKTEAKPVHKIVFYKYISDEFPDPETSKNYNYGAWLSKNKKLIGPGYWEELTPVLEYSEKVVDKIYFPGQENFEFSVYHGAWDKDTIFYTYKSFYKFKGWTDKYLGDILAVDKICDLNTISSYVFYDDQYILRLYATYEFTKKEKFFRDSMKWAIAGVAVVLPIVAGIIVYKTKKDDYLKNKDDYLKNKVAEENSLKPENVKSLKNRDVDHYLLSQIEKNKNGASSIVKLNNFPNFANHQHGDIKRAIRHIDKYDLNDGYEIKNFGIFENLHPFMPHARRQVYKNGFNLGELAFLDEDGLVYVTTSKKISSLILNIPDNNGTSKEVKLDKYFLKGPIYKKIGNKKKFLSGERKIMIPLLLELYPSLFIKAFDTDGNVQNKKSISLKTILDVFKSNKKGNLRRIIEKTLSKQCNDLNEWAKKNEYCFQVVDFKHKCYFYVYDTELEFLTYWAQEKKSPFDLTSIVDELKKIDGNKHSANMDGGIQIIGGKHEDNNIIDPQKEGRNKEKQNVIEFKNEEEHSLEDNNVINNEEQNSKIVSDYNSNFENSYRQSENNDEQINLNSINLNIINKTKIEEARLAIVEQTKIDLQQPHISNIGNKRDTPEFIKNNRLTDDAFKIATEHLVHLVERRRREEKENILQNPNISGRVHFNIPELVDPFKLPSEPKVNDLKNFKVIQNSNMFENKKYNKNDNEND